MMNKNVWTDGMLGLAVGDALGMPVQFMARSAIAGRTRGPVIGMEGYGTYYKPEGTWSDDTSMALAALDSIGRLGRIDLDDIMQGFVRWNDEGAYTTTGRAFDQGMTCLYAIRKYGYGASVSSCGKKGEMANGNGALMRILPVCLFTLEQADRGSMTVQEAVWTVHEAASLTHHHLRSNTACGMYWFLAKALIAGKGSGIALLEALQQGMDEAVAFYQAEGLDGELKHFERILDLKSFAALPAEEIRSTGYVVDSLEAALWSLLGTDSLEAGLLKAVNLGLDTDTVAAIAGGLAGIWYGSDAIPEAWMAVLAGKDMIEAMCEQAAQW